MHQFLYYVKVLQERGIDFLSMVLILQNRLILKFYRPINRKYVHNYHKFLLKLHSTKQTGKITSGLHQLLCTVS